MNRLVLLCGGALAALATAARAQITDETSTPVSSSTINNGSRGNVMITANGSIEIEDRHGVAAVTLDSNNTVDNRGLISLQDGNNTTGVLIKGGVSGDVIVSGTIDVREDYDREQDDDDRFFGPYARGVNRHGILLQGPGGFSGDIVLGAGARITIEGNRSAGMKLETALNGNLVNDGAITIIGDDAVGIDIRSGVTGDILQSGNITSVGKNASGVSIAGDVSGNFTNEATIVATGFASTTASNIEKKDLIHPDNLLKGGPAVSIGGAVADGFLNNGQVPGEGDDDDEKNSIEDFNENRSRGVIRSFGSGEAVLISGNLAGGAAGDLVLGGVIEKVRDTLDDDDDGDRSEIIATFNYDQGFINRGEIAANGLNLGFKATGLRIEGANDGSRRTIVEGGLLNTGAITARAFEADASAMSIGSHAQTQLIDNDGLIEARVSTKKDNAAYAILVESGAQVRKIVNTGAIVAASQGYGGTAAAIIDRSGTIETIHNQGSVRAGFIDDGEENKGQGSTRAIDLSGHGAGQGVTIIQSLRPKDADSSEPALPLIEGDVVFGAGDDRFEIEAGSVIGNIRFGAGNDTLSVSDAELLGTVNMGGGVNTVSFSDGSVFLGAIVNPSEAGSLQIEDSTVSLVRLEPLVVDTLRIDGDSRLNFLTSDLDSGDALITARQSATISSDTTIAVNVTEFRNARRAFLLIESGDLSVSDGATVDLDVAAPAIFVNEVDISDTRLEVILRPKTSDELGLNANETAAYSSLLELAENKGRLGTALTSYLDEDKLVADYAQLLPSYSDAQTRFLSTEASIATGAVGRRLDQLHKVSGANSGFWLQQNASYTREKADFEATGYDGFGMSFEAGYDRRAGDSIILGINGGARLAGYSTSDDYSNEISVTAYQLGLYASGAFGGLTIDVAGSAGRAQFDFNRIVSFGGMLDIYEGDTNGSYFSGSARGSYRIAAGSFYVEPTAAFDFFTLHQNGYVETSASTDAPLALRIGEARTGRTSGTALLRFGRDSRAREEQRYAATTGGAFSDMRYFQDFYAGYRVGVSETLYSVDAAFDLLDEGFEIADLKGYGDAVVGGLSIGAAGAGFVFSVSYDGEFERSVMTHRFGAQFRLMF